MARRNLNKDSIILGIELYCSGLTQRNAAIRSGLVEPTLSRIISRVMYPKIVQPVVITLESKV